MADIPFHICPVCGGAFRPVWKIRLPNGRVIERERKTAIYDHARCRQRAYRMKLACDRAGVTPSHAQITNL